MGWDEERDLNHLPSEVEVNVNKMIEFPFRIIKTCSQLGGFTLSSPFLFLASSAFFSSSYPHYPFPSPEAALRNSYPHFHRFGGVIGPPQIC